MGRSDMVKGMYQGRVPVPPKSYGCGRGRGGEPTLLFAQAAFGGEEVGEELCAGFGLDVGLDFDAVVQSWVGAELVEGGDGAGLGVGAAVDQFGDSRVDDRAGAHRAGFEGDRE